MGRAKRMTAKALQSGVQRYFDEISRVQPVTELVDDYQVQPDGTIVYNLDEMGHPRKKQIAVKNSLGEQVYRREWIEQPSITALCLKLGISADTFERYAKAGDEERGGKLYREVCAWARQTVASYWEPLLETKSSKGAQFVLSSLYGWSTKQEVKVSGGVEDYLRKLEAEGKKGVEY